MNDFSGKVALVTGGASGIGAAIAREPAQGGASVIVADLEQAVASELRSAGRPARAVGADMANAEAVERMVGLAVATWGALHLAVNNAGVCGPIAPVAQTPIDGWRSVTDVSMNGVFLLHGVGNRRYAGVRRRIDRQHVFHPL
jgi:NAD(P)-dependent dehydrogenase (short-subunit alcohol dehydrogenase family)